MRSRDNPMESRSAASGLVGRSCLAALMACGSGEAAIAQRARQGDQASMATAAGRLCVGLALLLAAGVASAQTPRQMRLLSTGGVVLSMVPPDCISTGASPCTLEFVGSSVTGPPLGTGTLDFTFTFLWSEASPNAHGLICVPVARSGRLTADDGSQIFTEFEGTLCLVGPPPMSPSTMHGAFTITGGTGRFEGATGGGNLSAGMGGRVHTGVIILAAE
jgi:hypothetical protein